MKTDVDLLTAKDEHVLGRTIEAGLFAEAALHKACPADAEDLALLVALGRSAFERFVSANLRLVWQEVHATGRRGAAAEELFQCGCVALVTAAQRWDCERGSRFAAIAVPYVRFALRDAMAHADSSGELSLRRARDVRSVRILAERFDARLPRAELAKGVGLAIGRPAAWVEAALRQRACLSFDETTTPVGEHAEEPDLRALMARLSLEQGEVIRWRFGLDGEAPLSLVEIARRLRCSEASVRRIEKAALETMRRTSAELAA